MSKNHQNCDHSKATNCGSSNAQDSKNGAQNCKNSTQSSQNKQSGSQNNQQNNGQEF